ncbi:chemotaxis protein CheB [Mycobacterium sp. WMMD1722]|uniref:chemotaxis protein CheB n=1 Tax=Mycobacterium sp. WMMD1722 TaxID=3404117 RepID=UPI003BF5A378
MPGPEVIVIGGSAGGMKAVQGIFSTLTGIGDSVGIVVLHRPPTHSPLTAVLQSYTRIPIREPDDSPSECPPGTVTVAPAGYHLLLGRRRRLSSDPQSPVAPYVDEPGVRAHLSLEAPVAYSRPSIDVTFGAAAEFADSVVAVLLSCANEDGAAGCAAVQAAGGRVVLQDPATCEAAVAVNAALRRVDPDHIADPRGIGEWLTAVVARTAG